MRGALAVAAARALERGALRGPTSRLLSAAWAAASRVARPVALPSGPTVVGIGGATLGGSYKTPLAIALGRALAAEGHSVALVSHAYGARMPATRVVLPGDDPRAAGDDALWAARALHGTGVAVISGHRNDALALAAGRAAIILVDGLLQASPRRVALSVLAVDASRPWGAGRCPPAGDLRARPAELLRAADVVAAIVPPECSEPSPLLAGARDVARVPGALAVTRFGDWSPSSPSSPLATLHGARVGLVVAVARPDRIVRALAAAGVHPVVIRAFRDHAAPTERKSSGGAAVDLWLTTPKCATKLGPRFEGAEVRVLRHDLKVPAALVRLVTEASRGGLGTPTISSQFRS